MIIIYLFIFLQIRRKYIDSADHLISTDSADMYSSGIQSGSVVPRRVLCLKTLRSL